MKDELDMAWRYRISSLLRNLFRNDRVEEQLDDEVRAHLAMLIDEKVAAGMTEQEARRAARIELGGIERVKEEVRDVRMGAMIEQVWRDGRYAARMMRRNPGFTAVVVFTLALGIGVNASIFSLVNALMLKPLPVVRDTDQLVWFRASCSYPNYQDYRDQSAVFSGISALSGTTGFSLNSGGRAELIKGEFVTASYFSVLGVDAEQGRAFLPEEDTPGSHPVAVISHNLWQSRFGGDPSIVGKTIIVNGLSTVIVGVAPKGFVGAEVGLPRDLWVPMMMYSQLSAALNDIEAATGDRLNDRNWEWLNVIARLKPGVTREQAEAATIAIAARVAEANNDKRRDERIRAASLLPVIGGLDPRDRIDAVYVAAFLMAIVGLVLLVACANVAGLLLARASARLKEVGLRQAIGASRSRIIRQLLTESMILSILGGSLGLLVAWWTKGLLVRVFSSTPIAAPDLSLDHRVLGFTLGVSILTTLIFGLAPAIQTSRTDVVSVLKNENTALRTSFRRSRLRNGFVVAQLALSVLLLIGSGLFIRSLRNAQNIQPGFAVENGLTLPIAPGTLRYSEERGLELYRQLIDGVEALPGVEHASLLKLLPLGLSFAQGTVVAEGRDPLLDSRSVQGGFNIVGAGYFQTMGIPLMRGREFGPQDRKGAAGAVVVNETLAHQLFPDQDPLGKRVRFGGSDEASLEIVGVASDSKYASLGEKAQPFIYQPLLQNYRGTMTLVIRTTVDPKSLVDAVRSQIRVLDPDLPVSDIKTLAEQVDFSLLPARVGAALLGVFGSLALLLAAIGTYGLVAYSVSHRTREIGIRMALGAQRSDVLKLVVKEGMFVVTIGIVIGLGLAFAVTRLIASFLYGVSASDPVTFLGISVLLTAVAMLASYIPARRAVKIDPIVALRYE